MSDLTTDEALRLVNEHAWTELVETCGHRGCEEHTGPGPKKIHTRRSGIGADILVEDIERDIKQALNIRWQTTLFHHDLVVTGVDGWQTFVDIPNPKRGQ